MATIITGEGNECIFTFSNPELEWIKLISDTLGITKEAVVGAAMNHGLTHYVEVFCKPNEPEPDKDHGTYELCSESPDQ